MPIEVVTHNGIDYPSFQTNGNAARFCRPFAEEVCKGEGFDIGCGKKEWAFPGAICIDPVINEMYDAHNLPMMQVDYIHSSHCWEHIEKPYEALVLWHSRLKLGGILFLYLPNMNEQTYHRPWSNTKHLHFVSPEIMKKYFEDNGDKWRNVFVSINDSYDAFICIAEKI